MYVSHQEQMSLVLRCVDVSSNPISIKEYFLGFINVDNTTGEALFNELKEALVRLELNIDDVRGQGYDNGSNMKGKYKGVQNRVLKINPRALFIPCGWHNLNLMLCDMANSCVKGHDFFNAIQRLYVLFSSSAQRWAILKDNVEGFTVKELSSTRWESQIESIKPLRFHAPQIRDALAKLADTTGDANARGTAIILIEKELENFEFLLCVVIWYEMLFRVNIVSKLLQSEDMDICVAVEQLKGLVIVFEKYRESGFMEAMIEAKELAKKMGIEPKFVEKRIIHRKVQYDEAIRDELIQSAEESFRVNYFVYIVDIALSSLKARFEQFNIYEKKFGFLFKLKESNDQYLATCCATMESF
ncbi:hypothetical protein LUZ60_012656 [Juncus effusus]|nr:hypothetical protein LUZ60_012656 [Juncus effusus]